MIYLIRHGETASNAARIMQWPDTPLSENGLDQARRLGERLREADVARILASDYARAHMTGAALQRATRAPLEIEPLLRERNFGDLRGRAYAEFAALGIEPFAADYAPPNGETWPEFRARVESAWVRMVEVASATRGGVAVVTHGLVCSVLMERSVALAPGVEDTAPPWHNTSVTEIEGPPWRATLYNCAAHLDELRDGARA